MTRRLLLILTIGAVAALIVVSLNPINGTLQRLILLTSLCGTWTGLVILLWRKRIARYGLLAVPLLLVVALSLPSRRIDTAELRAEYVRQMLALEGTRYLWGGENSRGIDCSGLPRKAFREAMLRLGLRRLDAGLLRGYLAQWWFDASAEALGQGYRHYTVPLDTEGSISEMSYADLMPGDLAVTDNGVHILAYLGGDRWIQADPGAESVIALDGHHADNLWYQVPVRTHRWSLLAAEPLAKN